MEAVYRSSSASAKSFILTRSDMKSILVSIILIGLPVASSAQGGGKTVEFPISFELGLNLRDREEQVPAGFFVGYSFNFDPFPDGSARKRKGLTADEVGIGGQQTAGTASINLMAEIERTIGDRTYGSTLIVAESLWTVRENGGENEGTYTRVHAPTGLRTDTDDFLSATLYNGRLIITGEISEPASFDGDSLYRLNFPMDEKQVLSPTATTSGGGYLTADTTYMYALTYQNQYNEESFRTDTVFASTTDGNQTITLTNVQPHPYWLIGGKDTAQVSGINIYRALGDPDGTVMPTFLFLDSVHPNAGSFIDAGTLTASTTDPAPEDGRVTPMAQFGTEWRERFWFTGQAAAHKTKYIATSVGIGDTLKSISPGPRTRGLVKYSETAVPVASVTDLNDGHFGYKRVGQDFEKKNIEVGDYFAARDTFETDTFLGRVAKKMSADSLVIKVINEIPSATTFEASIGNNIIKMGAELMAVVNDSGDFNPGGDTSEWLVIRGIFDSPTWSHTLRKVYLVDDGFLDQSVFYTEKANPLQQVNFDTPNLNPDGAIEVSVGEGGPITGLVRSPFGLLVFKKEKTYQITSDIRPIVALPIHDDIGAIAPKGVVPYRGGAITLSDRGVFWLGGSDRQKVGEILGNAIRDSAQSALFPRHSVGIMHNDEYYLSVVKSSDSFSKTWIYNFIRNTWRVYEGALNSAWGYPHFYAKWGTPSLPFPELYLGTKRNSGVYKIDRSVSVDADTVDGSAIDITAQVITPAYSIPNSYTSWTDLALAIDNNDSVRINVTYTQIDTTFTQTLTYRPGSRATASSTLSPTFGDTSYTAGKARWWSFDLGGVPAFSAQVSIWTTGAGRCVIHPGFIKGRPSPL